MADGAVTYGNYLAIDELQQRFNQPDHDADDADIS